MTIPLTVWVLQSSQMASNWWGLPHFHKCYNNGPARFICTTGRGEVLILVAFSILLRVRHTYLMISPVKRFESASRSSRIIR